MVHDKAFDLEKGRLIETIKRRGAKRVLIQLPNGLKNYAIDLSNHVEERTGAVVYISGGSCYGGCDLALQEAKKLEIDLIIHYGHAPFASTNFYDNIVYFSAPSKIDPSHLIVKALNLIEREKKIGLATAVQHLKYLENVKKILDENGYDAIIPSKGKFTIYNGQILGCDYSSLKSIENKVDCCLIIGSHFHGLGATLCLNKPVILVDPYCNEVSDISYEKNKILKQRYSFIIAAKAAKNIGIIIGMKIGQHRPEIAQGLRKLVNESDDRRSTLICMDEVAPENLNNFTEIDVFINTACPRVSVDDAAKFLKPVLTPKEALVALEKLGWEDLIEQGIF
ncbi:MAG: diphthamide biosynthesis enzyme Dph2 [Candidatus Bathyarchaeia archaeon]